MTRTRSNDSPKGEPKPKFSQSQYNMLKRCSDKKDISEWNKWREDNSAVKIHLEGANLKGSSLAGANLAGADLARANLVGANLMGVYPFWTNMERANLRGADLNWANLREANLEKADLSGASLEGATLVKANLDRAKLIGANLRGAKLNEANLNWANLRGANLEGADFYGVHLREADMRSTKFTPEGKPIGKGSFLDLGSCIGIETAKFSETNFLQDYLARAFEFAHKPDIHEAKEWPEFLENTIDNIKALRALFADQEPPKLLIEVVHVITGELIKYLKKHPEAMYEIKPRQFEELIAEILASYGWEVQLTPPTKDGGYDIFAISKDIKAKAKTSWIIECKKYASENKVGVDIVRALYGVKGSMSGVANALLATTSYFTKGVQDFKASRYDIELKDYGDILEWINEYRPNPDGKLYIKDNKLIVPGED